MTALLAKATALALVQHPAVNAACKDGKSFTYNANINIAVAVAMDGGLITPVLQDADKVNKIGAESLASEEIVELPSLNYNGFVKNWSLKHVTRRKSFEIPLFFVHSWISILSLESGKS